MRAQVAIIGAGPAAAALAPARGRRRGVGGARDPQPRVCRSADPSRRPGDFNGGKFLLRAAWTGGRGSKDSSTAGPTCSGPRSGITSTLFSMFDATPSRARLIQTAFPQVRACLRLARRMRDSSPRGLAPNPLSKSVNRSPGSSAGLRFRLRSDPSNAHGAQRTRTTETKTETKISGPRMHHQLARHDVAVVPAKCWDI
jgi:hypothetical protein